MAKAIYGAGTDLADAWAKARQADLDAGRLLERQEGSKPQPVRVAVRPVDDVLQIELVSGPDDLNLEDRLGKLDADHQIVRDVGPRILRHVAKEVKHEQFYDLDVLTVTVDTRPLV